MNESVEKSIDKAVTSYYTVGDSNKLPFRLEDRQMKMDEIFEEYGSDTEHRVQAIFSSIFVLQNRMQTAGEKLQTQISMKQWLLLAMTACCPEPCTLTNVGNLMGCSRQNIKKLALALEKKGFVRLLSGGNNSVRIELTDKADQYAEEMGERHLQSLKLLFLDFSDDEIKQLFCLYAKLFAGMERVEKYAEELDR